MGMGDGGRQLEETICCSSKKPTSKWLFTRGVCFQSVLCVTEHENKDFSLTKLKKRIMGNGEGGKKPILYPTEISHSPYDILTELNEKLDQACRRIEKQQ